VSSAEAAAAAPAVVGKTCCCCCSSSADAGGTIGVKGLLDPQRNEVFPCQQPFAQSLVEKQEIQA